MFTDFIMNYVKEQAVEQISKKIGIDPSLLTGQWGEDAIGSLVTGLFRNSQKEETLEDLDNAVSKDHDWSIFDDIGALLTKGEEGGKIVEHILGNNSQAVAGFLSKKLGISGEQAASLLSFVAPLVMGALGKKKQETGSGSSWLKDLLAQEEQEIAKKSDTPTSILQLLDKDGDGDVDLADFLAAK